MKISKNNAEHYFWGDSCDGWQLVKSQDLSVIHEKMPPNTAELRHYHENAKQFFFILKGQASIELDGEIVFLNEHEGIEIAPKTPHKMMNKCNTEIEFIVISAPTSKGDRVVLE